MFLLLSHLSFGKLLVKQIAVHIYIIHLNSHSIFNTDSNFFQQQDEEEDMSKCNKNIKLSLYSYLEESHVPSYCRSINLTLKKMTSNIVVTNVYMYNQDLGYNMVSIIQIDRRQAFLYAAIYVVIWMKAGHKI